MEPSKESLLARLQPYGQQHLLTYWEELDAGQRRWLAAQLAVLDLKTVAALFRQGVQAEDWEALARRAVAPAAFRLHDRLPSITPQQAQQRGQAALAAGQVGVILVAGGQGSRLGFQHPKGMYRVGPVSALRCFKFCWRRFWPAPGRRACGFRCT